MIALAAGMFASSCSKTPAPEPDGNTHDGMRVTHVWDNGNVDGDMKAYSSGVMSTYEYRMFAPATSASIIAHLPAMNIVYRYQGTVNDNSTHTTNAFVPVLKIKANPNAVWREYIITFNQGYTPYQFTKSEDVESAASGNHPRITVLPTNTVYRISTNGTFNDNHPGLRP